MPDTKLATVNFGPAKDCIEVVLFIIYRYQMLTLFSAYLTKQGYFMLLVI